VQANAALNADCLWEESSGYLFTIIY